MDFAILIFIWLGFCMLLVWAFWPRLKDERAHNKRVDTINRRLEQPFVEQIASKERVPKWVAKVRLQQRGTSGTGNGRRNSE